MDLGGAIFVLLEILVLVLAVIVSVIEDKLCDLCCCPLRICGRAVVARGRRRGRWLAPIGGGGRIIGDMPD